MPKKAAKKTSKGAKGSKTPVGFSNLRQNTIKKVARFVAGPGSRNKLAIGKAVYAPVRHVVGKWLSEVVEKSAVVAENANRKTVNRQDVIHALKSMGLIVHGGKSKLSKAMCEKYVATKGMKGHAKQVMVDCHQIGMTAFTRILNHIMSEHKIHIKFTKEAKLQLLYQTESFIRAIFSRAIVSAAHAKRRTIQPKDLTVVASILGGESGAGHEHIGRSSALGYLVEGDKAKSVFSALAGGKKRKRSASKSKGPKKATGEKKKTAKKPAAKKPKAEGAKKKTTKKTAAKPKKATAAKPKKAAAKKPKSEGAKKPKKAAAKPKKAAAAKPKKATAAKPKKATAAKPKTAKKKTGAKKPAKKQMGVKSSK
jgi:histone H3/H4